MLTRFQSGVLRLQLGIRSISGVHVLSFWQRTVVRGLVLLTAMLVSGDITVGDDRADHFEKSVRPLLLNHCVECHGPQKQEAQLRFDRRNMVLGGTAGDVPLVTAGRPEDSRMLAVLLHREDDVQMPPSKKLSDAEIEAVRQWITEGAVWPETSDLEADARARAERWREHWAFQTPVAPDLSQFPADTHPIDALIRQTLQEHRLQPSPRAETKVLVRRMSVAVVGLPPRFEDLAAAASVAGQREQQEWLSAYVDRLLGSPHFGERWGRYWLDVSRYADTKGYVFQEDREYHDAWRYREWVINSLNADMPYDEFLKRQLAADRLPGSDDGAQLAAMGFLTLGRRFLNNKHDIIDDRIDVTMRGMLGLTVGCARCHDHKFDPVPIADYYSLYGIFDSSDEPKNEPSTLRLVDRDKPVTPHIFVRGQPGNRGDAVPRRFLTALSAADAPEFTDGSGRLQLAEAIASADNPLTARIAVNRVWMHLFGRGFVDTPSDFGVRTPRPVHLPLMDYLADWFVRHNWSVKSLIRHVLTSDTWQQSSDRREDAEQIDPENRLLARMNRRRLDFESHRDAILAATGTLDPTVGGKSVDITGADPGHRRTIYARIDRQNLPGVFRTFDLANPDTHAPQRFQTTVPQQALYQLNNAFVMDQAEAVAAIARRESDHAAEQIGVLFRQILNREPSALETEAASAFLSTPVRSENESGQRSGWAYGVGQMDAQTGRLTAFNPLPRFIRGSWQGGKDLPDPVLGWTMLNRSGGHPGANLQFCAVRRFLVDVDCQLIITGEVAHSSEHGNGIRARILPSDGAMLAERVVHHTRAAFDEEVFHARVGQWVDFVVDSQDDPGFDSFTWKVQVVQRIAGRDDVVWDSEKTFGRQQSERQLDELSRLAQTLLMTNEFVFVD